MGIFKNIAGNLLDWLGVANVPAALTALAGLQGEAGQIIEIGGVDAQGGVTELVAVDKPGGGADSGQNVALTAAQVDLLEDAFAHIQWVDAAGPQYAAQLIASLRSGAGGGEEPEPETPAKTLQSISAVYDGGNVPVGTVVSSLSGVTVTAHYSDGSTANVTGYTLSGTIAEGENTVAVTYMGKTTTITVTGEAQSADGRTLLHNWVLSDAEGSEIDTVGGVEMVAYNSPVKSADGWTNDGNYKAIYATGVVGPNRTIEWDVSTDAQDATHAWLFSFGNDKYSGTHVVAYKDGGWGWENGATYNIDKDIPELNGMDVFDGKTVALCFGSDSFVSLFIDGVFVSTSPWAVVASNAIIGRNTASFHNVTVSACRVYEGVL